ncbi:ABC transporter permease subunit [uncultured Ruegeria sp.]|uniref:amino acid ABC transporter permease n=1 Tax=uncultured Ruegeria sp. TaxID=259304 RepID=UPI00261A63E0|nr:ABC transporter permease subunit [uncultured Ruegeria sp.]
MHRPTFRQAHGQRIFQFILLLGMAACVYFVAQYVKQRLDSQGIATGFGFLWDRAGYNLGESLIPYDGDDSYGRALLAGFSNTLKVAVAAIFFSLFLGFVAAVAMLSGHRTAERIAKLYVRVVRNTPVLLQLFFWFGIFTVSMPAPRETYSPLPHLYISNRGINFPAPDGTAWAVIAIVVAVLLAAFWLSNQRRQAGKSGSWIFLLSTLGCASLMILLTRAGVIAFEYPAAGRFSINGGATISPEFLTILIGLSVYTGTYIAEVLRGAVESISTGQMEAAQALGLSQGQGLRLVVLPQATRVAMPAVVSELLNLVKNSSLGVAVGYPELVSAGNTAMNQTGQAIELIAIYMLFYVTLNYVITKLSHVLEARYEW